MPFRTKPDTYYSITASPGQVVKLGDAYLMFFSATTMKAGNPCVQRTLSIARTHDLDGAWTPDPHPLVPIEEQVENSSLYYEPATKTWFLFTDHIGLDGGEFGGFLIGEGFGGVARRLEDREELRTGKSVVAAVDMPVAVVVDDANN